MPQKLKSEDNINQKQRNKNNKNNKNKNHNNDLNGKYSQKHIRINNAIREKK
jgi:hypothetical protein